MEKSINDRVKILIKELDFNPNSFSSELGITPPIIYNIVGGKRNKPSFDLLVKICNKFEQVNLDWLVLGTGDMFRGVIEEHENIEISDKTSQNALDLLEKEFQALESELESYKSRERFHLETISTLSKR